jgi:hypothetical protein
MIQLSNQLCNHAPLGMNTNLDFHLQGAPNFRVAGLNVYGVAQPTVTKHRFSTACIIC